MVNRLSQFKYENSVATNISFVILKPQTKAKTQGGPFFQSEEHRWPVSSEKFEAKVALP